MKSFYYFSLLLILPSFYSTGQTAEQILNNEMAFSCHLFTRLDISKSSWEKGEIDPERIPLSDETGFIYLNIPDSLIVIHYKILNMKAAISERLQIIAVKQKNPIILAAIAENMEEVLIHIIPRSGTFVQFYYPETILEYDEIEQIMAFEVLGLRPLGKTSDFVE